MTVLIKMLERSSVDLSKSKIKRDTDKLVAKKMKRVKFDRISPKLPGERNGPNMENLIDIMSQVTFYPDEDIIFKNPQDFRDMIRNFVENKDTEIVKELSLLYTQLILLCQYPEVVLEKFFSEIVNVTFSTKGCYKQNLYEYVLSLDDNSVRWYCLCCCFHDVKCKVISGMTTGKLVYSTNSNNVNVRKIERDNFTSLFKVSYLLLELKSKILPQDNKFTPGLSL